MNTAGVIVLVIVILLLVGGVGWVVFTRIRAQRLGLPPPPLLPFFRSSSSSGAYGGAIPQPAPGGIVGWFNDRVRAFKNRNVRTAAGAYEGPAPPNTNNANARASRRGFGPLDDEAWDARVGNDDDYHNDNNRHYVGPGGYYEEQELGLRTPGDTRYGGAAAADSYQMNVPVELSSAATEGRGRTRSRTPDAGGAGGLGVRGAGGRNPFDDEHAEPSNLSLRGVSPRPIDTGVGGGGGAKGKGGGGKGEDDSSPTERKSIFRENV